jgi:hypothetical protein
MVQTASLPDLQQTKALTTAGGDALRMSPMKVIVAESIGWLTAGRHSSHNVAKESSVCFLKRELDSSSACQKLPCLYVTRSFITAFTRTDNWSLS